MGNYIGIDIGTSSAKLLLMDGRGQILNSVSRGYEAAGNVPGWKEIDPKLWMKAVEEGLEELLEKAQREKIEAIGVTGQMHTLVLVDKQGEPLRPALMWNDTRTAPMLPGIKEQIRKIPEVSYLAGVVSTGSPAVNLLWVKEKEPENFRKIHKFLIGPDYIVFRMTGNIQTDYCEASTSSLCDLNTGRWSSGIRERFGFPEQIYPDIRGTGETAGRLLPDYQKKYRLGSHVKVIVGTGDNPAAAIAAGCFAKGYPVLSLGTSGVLIVPKEKIEPEAKGKNILFSLDGKKRSVLVQGTVQSCGSSLSWWMGKIQLTEDYEGETRKISRERLGENPVLFYPHLTGDKTIYGDAGLRGCFLGLGTDVTRTQMNLAVLEGICLGIRQLAEEMKIPQEKLQDLCVTGGGSKNEVWMQILSDVLNTSVVPAENTSGAGYGIALAAAEAAGEKIRPDMHREKRFLPRKYNADLYEKKYRTYRRIYESLQNIYHP